MPALISVVAFLSLCLLLFSIWYLARNYKTIAQSFQDWGPGNRILRLCGRRDRQQTNGDAEDPHSDLITSERKRREYEGKPSDRRQSSGRMSTVEFDFEPQSYSNPAHGSPPSKASSSSRGTLDRQFSTMVGGGRTEEIKSRFIEDFNSKR